MQDHAPVLTHIKMVPFKAGHLEIHEKTCNGEIIQRAFTLTSLADALHMPHSTMEGKYVRAKLHYWKIDIQTGIGRPKRGFLMAQLGEVVRILETRGGEVQWSPNREFVQFSGKQPGADLVPSFDARGSGKPLYTVDTIAEHFGVSVTTVRNKLRKSGLYRHLESLQTGVDGGRPKKAMPEARMGDVKLVFTHNANFGSELDRVLLATEREAAKVYAAQNTAPHTAPVGLQAFDRRTLAPTPPKDLRSEAEKQAELESWADLVRQIEETPLDSEVKALPPSTPAQSAVNDVNVETDDVAANLAAGRAHYLAAFIAMDEEPTQEALDETTDMLSMSRKDAQQFCLEVDLGRGAK